MEKLSSSLKNMLLSLGIICLSMAAVLGAVYQATSGPIANTEIKTKTEALSKVLPEFDNNPLDDMQTVAIEGEPDSLKTYKATAAGKLVGYAVETYSKNGFGGEISLMIGFDTEGVIKDFTVLKHGETPGLGAKMNDWFHQPNRKEGTIRNFCGVSMPEEHPLKVTKDGGKVDAITASTISSRAFIDALERAYKAFMVVQNEGSTGEKSSQKKVSSDTEKNNSLEASDGETTATKVATDSLSSSVDKANSEENKEKKK